MHILSAGDAAAAAIGRAVQGAKITGLDGVLLNGEDIVAGPGGAGQAVDFVPPQGAVTDTRADIEARAAR